MSGVFILADSSWQAGSARGIAAPVAASKLHGFGGNKMTVTESLRKGSLKLHK
jgi:hypothetical protein